MLFSLLLVVFAGTSPVIALIGRTLQRRGPQTSAVCTVDFLLVHSCIKFDEYVHQSELNDRQRLHMVQFCNFSHPLTANANTDPPSSWLAYNLLAACADCQGFMQAVPKYHFQYPHFISLLKFWDFSYFPSSYPLPDGTFIPYWATTDPTTWPSQHFDVTTAKNISQQGHRDISSTAASASKKKRTPIGLIVGMIVGGLALVALAGGTTFLICRRRRTTRPPYSPSVTMEHLTHIRSPSDITMTSIGSLGYATLVSTSTSPQDRRITTYSHDTSPQSPSYLNSPIATIPHTTLPTATRSNLEGVIDPFISPLGPINIPPGDRKSATGPTPVNDASTTTPIRIQSWAEPRRSRLNPPPYSATDDSPSPSARTQRRHTHQTDTYWTHTSGPQSGSGQAGASPFGDLLARVPENSPPARERVGGELNIDSKREKRKGTKSVDPRDIA
ncbi:uncharacterized protein LACBIDRAFT_332107 [Laccaria bicolor S238N-H82]|uniref:Predicted protein n=1 Tax=Laccaria bicolor (strain S238N-H82 / ATCC MYA-4686) TaxID=486041 RepID=B0DRL6_LACBS|nr:uncharacterized protein LACBIDRAFT_332107 [Laccaria bicolor S238N-H82]EDR02893.1 predicted protein [Laccaria bicolor S238N-H82]|eukprot:XP_001886603.1 predicted protein [Laccaria bicolor S238N-H82]